MQAFRHSFTLNDKIDIPGITAKYQEGVLNVTLPKKEATAAASQQITVG